MRKLSPVFDAIDAVDVVVAITDRMHGVADRLATADRGLSTTLNYVLILGIVSILVTTLLAGVGGLVDNQQEATSREQLEVIGNRVAADLQQVDTLASHADDGNAVSVRADLPSRVVGSSYTIEVVDTGSGTYELILTTGDPKTTVTVPFRSTTDVAEGKLYGGPLVFEVSSTGDDGEVVIRRA